MSLKKRFIRIAASIEDNFDLLSAALRKHLNHQKDLQIITFRSYGTPGRLYVKGRVLKDKQIRKSTAEDSFWDNIVNMYRRFETDEVAAAQVELSFHNKLYSTETDREGYFIINIFSKEEIISDQMWYEVGVTLKSAPYAFKDEITSIAHVLVPPADAEYGIISDIDDTIVKTTATSLLSMARNTFFHNAHSRLPFAGVSEFYRALQKGRNGKRNNPFFYVSSSPWNLYDLLIDFMDINDIPEGPLLLRDFGLDKEKKSGDHMGHKFYEIENILKTYPQLQFVLIGDSGQEDPTIYKEVVRQYPGRILAIYIRDVQLKDREKIAFDVARETALEKVEMVIVDNTVEAAEHAAKNGLIFTDEIEKVVEDKERDKGKLPGKKEI
ncbi:MAG TPA: phosphatase domain-containing protein [Chryseosolibacter sp.]|nr:phosphatase domain-containing protein [Chryseosolibacter sp.]